LAADKQVIQGQATMKELLVGYLWRYIKSSHCILPFLWRIRATFCTISTSRPAAALATFFGLNEKAPASDRN